MPPKPLSLVNAGSEPHVAAVNNGPWKSFPNRAAAQRWMLKHIVEGDVGWIHPASAFDADGKFIGEGPTRQTDEELLELADVESGNCTHDAFLGLNTSDCPRCNARRELRKRRGE